jgi:hypothetical protein
VQLILKSPPVNGSSSTWQELLNKAESERAVLCMHLDGKALFTAMLRMYAAIYREIRDSLQLGKEHSEKFREQKRRKRIPSKEQPRNMTTHIRKDSMVSSQGEVPTRNFFAPSRTEMDVERNPVEETTDGPNQSSLQASSSKQGRPPPIVLTSTTNLIQLQRHIKGIATGNFEFHNTRSGTRIVLKEVADFSAIKKYLDRSNLPIIPNFRSRKTL